MGCTVEERVPLTSKPFDPDIFIDLNWNLPNMPEEHSEMWTESLGNVKGKVLATYKNGNLTGKPAIAENMIGKGKVVVMGTYPGAKSFGVLVKQYATLAGIQADATGDPGMVVVSRTGRKGNGTVVVNITDKSKTIDLPFDAYSNLLTDKPVSGKKLTVSPFEVMVLKK
jgi:beta-galactosidase GanA